MKFTILALTLLAVSAFSVNGAAVGAPEPQGVNFGTVFLNYLKAFATIMPCGVPSLGIPPLAPFTLEKYDYNYASEMLNIQANLSNLYVSGLNKAEILQFTYDEETSVFTYDINYPEFQILGAQSTEIWAYLAGFSILVKNKGLMNVKVTDYRSVGSFKIAPNAQNHLEMSDDHINFYYGDVQINNWNEDWDIAMNNYVNNAIKNLIVIWGEEVQPNFTALWNKMFLPIVNNGLEQVTEAQFVSALEMLTEQFYAMNCISN